MGRPRQARALVRRDGALWVCDRTVNGERHRTWHRTREDAERAAGDSACPSGDSRSTTLADAFDAYRGRLLARSASSKHLRDIDRLAGILERLRGIPVRSLSPSLYLEWDAARTRGGSSARVLVRVRGVLAHAVRLGWLDRDPLAAVEFARPAPGPVAIHTATEALRLLDAADGALRLWLALGYLGGLRPSEALAIRWSQVEDGRLAVLSAKARSARVRVIEIMPRLSVLLSSIATGAISCNAGCNRGRPVSTLEPGTVVGLTERQITLRLREACARCGVVWSPDVARHTCASHLIALWRDSARVALHLGHSSTAMLWRHYRAPVSREDAERLFGVAKSVKVLKEIV